MLRVFKAYKVYKGTKAPLALLALKEFKGRLGLKDLLGLKVSVGTQALKVTPDRKV